MRGDLRILQAQAQAKAAKLQAQQDLNTKRSGNSEEEDSEASRTSCHGGKSRPSEESSEDETSGSDSDDTEDFSARDSGVLAPTYSNPDLAPLVSEDGGPASFSIPALGPILPILPLGAPLGGDLPSAQRKRKRSSRKNKKSHGKSTKSKKHSRTQKPRVKKSKKVSKELAKGSSSDVSSHSSTDEDSSRKQPSVQQVFFSFFRSFLIFRFH